MKFIQLYYECNICDTRFNSPTTRNDYGEFIMRDDKGNMAYLNAFDDDFFKEFGTLIDSELNGSDKNKISRLRMEMVHENFGYTCDPSPDGTFYQIKNKPPCPKCGAKQYKGWGLTNPPEFVEIDMTPVSHNRWHALASEQKKKILQSMVERNIEHVKYYLKN